MSPHHIPRTVFSSSGLSETSTRAEGIKQTHRVYIPRVLQSYGDSTHSRFLLRKKRGAQQSSTAKRQSVLTVMECYSGSIIFFVPPPPGVIHSQTFPTTHTCPRCLINPLAYRSGEKSVDPPRRDINRVFWKKALHQFLSQVGLIHPRPVITRSALLTVLSSVVWRPPGLLIPRVIACLIPAGRSRGKKECLTGV